MNQLAVIGLGTMGANLARNAARNGAKVAVYNRTAEKTDEFMEKYASEGDFVACKSLEEVVAALEPPRPILLMVKAGGAVDAVMEELSPLLEKGDVIIDAGNSHYEDTDRRMKLVEKSEIHFVGMGVSGGEEGALNGPSMMPGGSEESYKIISSLMESMSADDGDGGKCISLMGPGGAGHFVKMVHNGIEYGIMQLIAESYDLLKSEAGKSNEELAEIFASWNEGEDLNSFLIEITAKIFEKGDVLDVIKDAAGQKGTGRWTTEAALKYGVAIPTINAAVDARIISGSNDLRKVGKEFPESTDKGSFESENLASQVRSALELSIICAYTQGFDLINVVSKEKNWELDNSEIARVWSGGCIIRSEFLKKRSKIKKTEVLAMFEGEKQLDWRKTVAIGTGRGIPLPAMTASLSYYDSLRRERLPQNLIQAQRDFFGAHTYERTDKEGSFHTEW
jgi:6-phosphogluconate dehydrogenase